MNCAPERASGGRFPAIDLTVDASLPVQASQGRARVRAARGGGFAAVLELPGRAGRMAAMSSMGDWVRDEPLGGGRRMAREDDEFAEAVFAKLGQLAEPILRRELARRGVSHLRELPEPVA